MCSNVKKNGQQGINNIFILSQGHLSYRIKVQELESQVDSKVTKVYRKKTQKKDFRVFSFLFPPMTLAWLKCLN